MSNSPATPRPSRLAALRRRKMIILFSILGLILAGAAATPWFLARWRTLNARDIAEEAQQRMDEKDYKTAMPLLVKAWRITPGDSKVLRSLGRACDELPGAATDAAVFWRRLADTGAASPDDQVSLAASLLKVSDPVSARKVLEAIPEEARHQLRYAEVLSSLLRNEGHEKEATQILRAAWEAAPADPACRLKLALMDSTSPFDPIREAAKKSLWEVARSGGQPGTDALKVITASPDLQIDQVPEVHRLLDANPGLDPLTRLRILAGCVRKFPQFAEEFVTQEAPRVAAQKLEDRTEFYDWVARLGDDTRIMNDLSEPESAKNPNGPRKPRAAVMHTRNLFLAYGDALIRAERWKEFSEILDQHDLPIGPADAAMMRAMCAKGLGLSDEEIDRRLHAALDSTRISHGPGEVERVADVAERLGRPAIAVEACLAAEPGGASRLEAQRRILRLQQKLRDADGMLRTTASILTSNPGLGGFVEQSLYLKILTGRDLEAAAREVVAMDDSSSLLKLTAAISSYAEGDLTAVRARIASVRDADLPPGPRAVLAGLMAKTGSGADGYRIAEKIPADSILPDEEWFREVALR